MKGIIRIGDKTSSGGTVLSGSMVMIFRGIGAARQGDSVICPIPGHGSTVIAEGHPTLRDNGVPVAFHGHRCACGCALISSLPEASVN
ncbi:Zn-binding Pro-Ala-Ala-Arg (PAAR) domain-containing protein, incolved in TypeVI secretion [Pseudomonas syringae]|uniref:PAAR domain-containing protein n=1 Tax=Pseudomonas syringae TaxID=317 RepID=UPI000896EEC3|nr:PAAR domain-containing protein [Pseudomonas syringae]SDX45851.1 Zn-binding Pro-Ala-Ala-Arg (PAAR) domain-containing protein, incolved in TypeVI secretion [Pseudomonas syringae]SFM59258.1 Zn-binding Pro-Ala-Ala-Arg (PAAR) domain-containing protein, incolved in TypeVI secretion [Pseudomonas syringae]